MLATCLQSQDGLQLKMLLCCSDFPGKTGLEISLLFLGSVW